MQEECSVPVEAKSKRFYDQSRAHAHAGYNHATLAIEYSLYGAFKVFVHALGQTRDCFHFQGEHFRACSNIVLPFKGESFDGKVVTFQL
jgi:hypothetical protein